jgi:hypothetical protein
VLGKEVYMLVNYFQSMERHERGNDVNIPCCTGYSHLPPTALTVVAYVSALVNPQSLALSCGIASGVFRTETICLLKPPYDLLRHIIEPSCRATLLPNPYHGTIRACQELLVGQLVFSTTETDSIRDSKDTSHRPRIQSRTRRRYLATLGHAL